MSSPSVQFHAPFSSEVVSPVTNPSSMIILILASPILVFPEKVGFRPASFAIGFKAFSIGAGPEISVVGTLGVSAFGAVPEAALGTAGGGAGAGGAGCEAPIIL